jgi:hypothetical protein
MAQFKQLALDYVLTDDETKQRDLAGKAARGVCAVTKGYTVGRPSY